MNYNKKTVRDIDVAGKKVLVRCDFNVPLKDGVITDTKRIDAALPTIEYLVNHNAKVILCSHLGRPKGEFKPEFSLKPVAEELKRKLGQNVILAKDVIGPDAKALCASLKLGQVILLENVRFHKEETKNDMDFAKELASLADIYVNDAFGTAHRAHASTEGVSHFLPSVAGFLIEKELKVMGGALENPERPFVAILGGAKVSDKIGVITNLISKVDTIIIGGAMAYTFIKAEGGKIGASLVEDDKLDLARELIKKAADAKINFLLPDDNIIGKDPDGTAGEYKVSDSNNVPDGWMGLDIGPKTRDKFTAAIKGAKTIVWNGPMGVCEVDETAKGTLALASAIAETDAVSIVGGGDSAAAVEKLGYADKMTHISTGGGASLEFLEGLELPGIACLMDK
jgi:phosphoglycerate kinase